MLMEFGWDFFLVGKLVYFHYISVHSSELMSHGELEYCAEKHRAKSRYGGDQSTILKPI